MTNINYSALGTIGVLYGGVSAERAVSLSSGEAVLSALSRLGANVVAIDLQSDVIRQINQANIDVAFIALHGGIGEDGRLQSLLDMMGIPYTGSDMQASVLAMNKLLSKQIWQGIGLSNAAFEILDEQTNFNDVLKKLGGSAMVKPAHEGSSLGMSLVYSAEELAKAYHSARQYDAVVFAEKLLTGGEYTVAILNSQALPVIKLETDHAFYDYDAKYIDNDTRYICPCGLSAEKEDEIKTLAVDAFNSLHCQGWGRVDIMVDEHEQFQVLEVNTVPGMTSHSLVPMAAQAAGFNFDTLIEEVLKHMISRYGLQGAVSKI